MKARSEADAGHVPPQNLPVPYPPSGVDHLMAWIGRLPGPAWAFYGLLAAALILVTHGLRWLDGSLSPGVLDPARAAEAPLVIFFLALMHYLNTTARRSLDAFRPALGIRQPAAAHV